MSLHNAQRISNAGLEAVYIPADIRGDKFLCTGSEFLHIVNSSPEDRTLTITSTRSPGILDLTGRVWTIPSGKDMFIGPFRNNVFSDVHGYLEFYMDKVEDVYVTVLKTGA